MRTIRLAVVGACLGLLHCAPAPKASPETSSDPFEAAAGRWTEPVMTDRGALVSIARIEGYGNPATGELWIRAIPTTPEGEPREDGVESSAQALSRAGGYCALTVAADATLGTNPNDTFEFYTLGNVPGALAADLSSFVPATCHTKLESDLSTDGAYATLFSSVGSGCAHQRVKNFYDRRFEHVFMDIDVWNGNYTTNGPYGPGFTNGTTTTRPGRRAPSEALGLWDFGAVEPRGMLGDTVDLWIYFKNAPGGGDFNFTGNLVGEVIEDCTTVGDDDCDGVANNNCGTVEQGDACFSDEDCQLGLRCAGATIRTRFGAANGAVVDTQGTCVPEPFIGGHVASAGLHGCAIMPAGSVTPGAVKCWGTNGSSQLGLSGDQPTAETAPLLSLGSQRATHLAAGPLHNCATFEDGSVRCWGDDSYGQSSGKTPGSPVLATATPPTPIDVGAPAVQVATGMTHSCVLRDDGGVRCWGDNSVGQAGAKKTNTTLSVKGSSDVVFHTTGVPKQALQLCAGKAHNCVLLDDGEVVCWGANSQGQLGYGNTTNIGRTEDPGEVGSVSVLGSHEKQAGRFVKGVSCGGEQTCAILDDGSLRCWGKGTAFALGYGTNVNVGDNELPSSMPLVGVGGPVKQVTMGDEVTCALLTSGKVKCWGWTGRYGGCLGYSAGCSSSINSPLSNPIDLGTGLTAVELSTRVDQGSMCAVLSNGGVKCWGGNAQYQCGYGDTANPISPPRAAYTLSAPGNNAGDPCQGEIDCTPGNACYNEVCVHEGRLRFALSWTPDTDLDLHVLTPDATHIYYSTPSAGGGVLDVDDCAGSCARPGETHVENVYFSGSPQLGTYTFYGHAFSLLANASYQLQVFLDGALVETHSGTFTSAGQESTHFTFSYPPICGDGFVSSGEECDADDSVFVQANGLTNSCTTANHTSVTGEDRGGIAIGTDRVVYSGDTATAAFELDDLSSSMAWPMLYDGLTSDLGTGQLWALGNAGPLTFGAGSSGIPALGANVTVTKLFPIDEATGVAGPPVTLSQPVMFRAREAGIFAGPTVIALYGTPDNGATRHIYIIYPATGEVEDYGTTSLAPNSFGSCDSWAFWGFAEVINEELHLTYVNAAKSQIVRTRMSDGASSTLANFGGSLGQMCAITVQASTGRWFFHQKGDSVLAAPGASVETIAACQADLAMGSTGDGGCDSRCQVRPDYTCTGTPSVCSCSVVGEQDNDGDGDCAASCATAGLSCTGDDVCDDSSGTAACVPTYPPEGTASMVLGQPSMLTSAQATSAFGMRNPEAVAIDPNSHKVFVADANNHRVLRFASLDALVSGAAAERVFGQTSFTNASPGSGTTQMNYPGGVAVDSVGRLWVADRSNGRVLRFDDASAPGAHGPSANGVLGQGGTGSTSFTTPLGVVADGPTLWVSDNSRHRVLRFDNAALKANNAAADGVLGQPDFDTISSGNTADKMSQPTGLGVGDDGALWVAEAGNHRVVRFDAAALKANGANADGVLGQSGFGMSSSGLSQSRLNHPQGVTISHTGWVFVPEFLNRRILAWNPAAASTDGANATLVIGAPDFTTAGSGTATSSTIAYPAQVFYDRHSLSLWVADYGASRVLRFGRAISLDGTADLVLGQVNMTSSVVGTGTAVGMSSPSGVAVDPATGKVFVADFYNHRVLRYASREALMNGAAAEGVLGQGNFTGASPASGAARMNLPTAVFVDLGGRLWVADGNNRRVLRFDGAATKANGANADSVLGAADFGSSGTNVCTQSLMAHPSGLFADSAGRLWVSDDACGRVLRFDNAPMLSNGANAAGVLGQPTFTEPVFTARGITQALMSNPIQVWLDASNRLWVADQARVLRYDDAPNRANGALADGILGQQSFTANLNSPVSASSSHAPKGVVVSGSGWVYMSHQGNQRITIFDPDAALTSGAEAIGVIGQPNLTSSGDNPVAATSMWYPDQMFYDVAADRLWLCDTAYNRVLAYDPSL